MLLMLVILTIVAVFIIGNKTIMEQRTQPIVQPTSIPTPTPPVTSPTEPEPRSREVLNPSGTHSAYIEPYEWEICGNIFVKNMTTGKIKQLTNYIISRSNKPKQIAWFNDSLMLVIEGYTWGTVTVGGSLYFVNSKTGEYNLIMKPPREQEIAEVSKHSNSIVLRVAKWTGNRMDYTLHTHILDADSVFKSILP